MSWRRAREVLAVRLDTLGDVLMTGPALRALKESLPGRRVTLLTSRPGAEAAALLPEVDAVIEYAAPWMKAPSDGGPGADRRLLARLRAGRFDAAVIFTVYTQSALPAALACRLAGVPLRLAHSRENPYGLLTHWVPESEPERRVRHEVRRQLELVAAVGCAPRHERLALRVPAAARRRAARLLAAAGVPASRPWVMIHPGASAASRRYPAEGFGRAAGRLSRERRLPVVLTGSRDEAPLAAEVLAAMGTRGAPAVSLAGRLGLAELAAVAERASVVISNNTGPAHVAAAVGTPVVDLYALTNPQHAPWGVPARVLYHDVPCRFCYKSVCPERHNDCLRLVSPDRIVAAACALLREARR